MEGTIRPRLFPTEQALVAQKLSVGGRPFLVLSNIPFPPSSACCSFGAFGFPSAHAGVLSRRGHAMEIAAARVCREAGARVSTNVLVRDLDLLPLHRADARRLEVVADGLPIFHGAQIAVDTTLVSPLKRDGNPPLTLRSGAALRHVRRRKERAHPELLTNASVQGQEINRVCCPTFELKVFQKNELQTVKLQPHVFPSPTRKMKNEDWWCLDFKTLANNVDFE